MKYRISETSLIRLETCDPRLRTIFNRVIIFRDCTIITGHRQKEEQNEAFRTGSSERQWPTSEHNSKPSMAIDAAPYFPGIKIPWNDRRAFDHFAGFVLGIAASEGNALRWGGDWQSTYRPGHDITFHDLPHFELVNGSN